MRSLVVSVFLYACESWNLKVDLKRRMQATEMRCFRRLLGISYRDHVTNEEMGNSIRQTIGHYEELVAIVKKTQNEMVWACHTINGACQDNHARYCARRARKRKTGKDGRITSQSGQD